MRLGCVPVMLRGDLFRVFAFIETLGDEWKHLLKYVYDCYPIREARISPSRCRGTLGDKRKYLGKYVYDCNPICEARISPSYCRETLGDERKPLVRYVYEC